MKTVVVVEAADTTTCTTVPPEETTTGIRLVVVVVVVVGLVEIVSHTVLPATCSDQPSRPVLNLLTPAG